MKTKVHNSCDAFPGCDALPIAVPFLVVMPLHCSFRLIMVLVVSFDC